MTSPIRTTIDQLERMTKVEDSLINRLIDDLKAVEAEQRIIEALEARRREADFARAAVIVEAAAALAEIENNCSVLQLFGRPPLTAAALAELEHGRSIQRPSLRIVE